MIKRNETDFRDRVIRGNAASLTVRHDKQGMPLVEHPACNCTLARIRAAMRNRKTTAWV